VAACAILLELHFARSTIPRFCIQWGIRSTLDHLANDEANARALFELFRDALQAERDSAQIVPLHQAH
jgi:hypothetical protein